MDVNFKTSENGHSITICPNRETDYYGQIIRVGSNNCTNCVYFVHGNFSTQIICCNHHNKKTYIEGINDSIRIIRQSNIFPNLEDKFHLLESLEKLKK